MFGNRILRTSSFMRSLLSSSGKTAWDATVDQNWFEVSSSDYSAVSSGLTNISKIGMSDVQVTESGGSLGTNILNTLPQVNATFNIGYYTVGAVFNMASVPGIVEIRGTSVAYKAAYVNYTALSPSFSISSVGLKYFLFKKPLSSAPSTFYLAIIATSGTLRIGTTTWPGSANNSGSSWVTSNSAQPIFQVMTTNLVQW